MNIYLQQSVLIQLKAGNICQHISNILVTISHNATWSDVRSFLLIKKLTKSLGTAADVAKVVCEPRKRDSAISFGDSSDSAIPSGASWLLFKDFKRMLLSLPPPPFHPSPAIQKVLQGTGGHFWDGLPAGQRRFQIRAREPWSYSELVGLRSRLHRSRFCNRTSILQHFSGSTTFTTICTSSHSTFAELCSVL